MDGLIGCFSADTAGSGASKSCLWPQLGLSRLMCSSVAATNSASAGVRITAVVGIKDFSGGTGEVAC